MYETFTRPRCDRLPEELSRLQIQNTLEPLISIAVWRGEAAWLAAAVVRYGRRADRS